MTLLKYYGSNFTEKNKHTVMQGSTDYTSWKITSGLFIQNLDLFLSREAGQVEEEGGWITSLLYFAYIKLQHCLCNSDGSCLLLEKWEDQARPSWLYVLSSFVTRDIKDSE